MGITAGGEDICAEGELAPIESCETGEDMAVSAAMVAGDDGALTGADGGMLFEAGGAGEERASGEDIEEAGLTGAAGDEAPDIGGCAADESHVGQTVTNSETTDVTVGAEGEAMSDGAEGATAFAVPADGTFIL